MLHFRLIDCLIVWLIVWLIDWLVSFAADNENAKACEKVIEALETIDDEAHGANIDFVKIHDEKLAKKYGIHAFPALVYLKNGEPTIFAGKNFCKILFKTIFIIPDFFSIILGDLRKAANVLAWLLDQKSPGSEDVIEEIKGADLEKLIDTTPNVAVYFCKYLPPCPRFLPTFLDRIILPIS